MPQHTASTYLLVGTVTKDLLANDSFVTGGTVTYAATVVKNLGWRPTILTAAASDFTPPDHLADVDWRILPAAETTTFRNEYTPQGRRQTIGPIARSITKADIPADCREPDLVHLCPLAQDVRIEVIDVFKASLRGATLQGWLRRWDNQGVVSLSDWPDAELTLSKLDAAVLSIEDLEGKWAIAEKWATQIPTLIVTTGEQGCTVFHHAQKTFIPPRPAQVLDPTGAGDVFAAAFFIRFQETGNLWEAAYFANVTASMAIELQGPRGVPARADVEAYVAQNSLVI